MSQSRLTLTKSPATTQVPRPASELAYIQRSRDLLTERLYTVPMSATARWVTKHAIERLGHEAMRLHWGLTRFATKNPR